MSEPLRNGLPWRFCAKCGSRMAWARATFGYDRQTGVYGENFAWRCPHWRPGDRTQSHDCSNTTVRDPGTAALSQ